MKCLAIALLLLCAACSMPQPTNRGGEEDDVSAAVFQWLFDHNSSAQQQQAPAYYLKVGEKGGDPTDDFMKRFADHKPPVRKGSACRDTVQGVLDKQTGERGVVFRVTEIEWKSDTEVQVKGGYFEHGLSASGNTYTVRKVQGKWKVTKDKMDWIS